MNKLGKYQLALIGVCFLGTLSAHAATVPEQFTLEQAVDLLLERNSKIKVMRQNVVMAKGVFRQAHGPFDFHFISELNSEGTESYTGGASDKDKTANSAFKLGVQKQLLWGTQFEASWNLNRTDFDLGHTEFDGRFRRHVMDHGLTLALSQPLLKGGGARIVAANLENTKYGLKAAQYNLKREISARIYAAIDVYTKTWSSEQSLMVARDMLERAKKNVVDAKILIRNNSWPAAEMNQIQANLSARYLQMYEAQRRRREAVVSLASVLGLSISDKVLNRPLSLKDVKLETSNEPLFDALATVDIAIKKRSDLRSKIAELSGANILNDAGEADRLPSLSLDGRYSYYWPIVGNGTKHQYAAQLASPTTGHSGMVSVNLSWPLAMNDANGVYETTSARRRQVLIEIEDLKRSIRNEALLSLEQVTRSGLILQQTKQSSHFYRVALASENEKLRAGMSTVIDIINTEDRLSSILQSEIQARANYVLAVARLRFVTGTLLHGDGLDFEVRPEMLIEVPKQVFQNEVTSE